MKIKLEKLIKNLILRIKILICFLNYLIKLIDIYIYIYLLIKVVDF